jgi:RND superfamily putative drug exporter
VEGGFGRAVVRHRGKIALAWLLSLAALLPAARRLNDRLEVSARILGSESAAVERTLAERFESPFATSVLLVVTGAPGPFGEEGRGVLQEVVATVRAVPGVVRTFSYLDQRDPFFVGKEGRGTFVVVGLDPAGGRPDRLLPRLREGTERAARRLRVRHPGILLRYTGEAAFNFDLWRFSTEEARAAERRTLPVTLLLLVLAFSSLGAALLPVAAGVVAVVFSFGLAGLLAATTPLSILIVNVVSMLGLALGIDYALLTVSRFRESRVNGRAPEAAAAEAASHAGLTVGLSGAAVAIGFLSLFAVRLNELRSAALGGVLVVLVSVAFNATVLPGVLAWLGSRVDLGWLPGRRATGDRFRPWGRWVVRHPVAVLLVAGVPLALLAAQARHLRSTIPRGDWLPASLESVAALGDLRAMGRNGVVETVRVVVDLPEETSALSQEGWDALRRVEEAIGRDPRVARVQSLRTLAGDRADDLAYVSLLPGEAKRTFLGGEGDAALLEAVPAEGLEPPDVVALVRDLRALDAAAASGLAGVALRIGGLPAFNADYEDAVTGRGRHAIALVILATLLSLFAAFRSVLVPLKAVALNLLAVAGAMGAMVLVFQDGYGVRLLGLARPLDGVFPIVPVLAFCTVFGLSMDYEVFLLARVREARRAGLGEDEALVEGLARTASLITSAAAIMIAVFAAFVLGRFVLVKMLGFALAVAVLLDATVIRLAIGPALLRLAGRWNWWPGDRAQAPPAGSGGMPITGPGRPSSDRRVGPTHH